MSKKRFKVLQDRINTQGKINTESAGSVPASFLLDGWGQTSESPGRDRGGGALISQVRPLTLGQANECFFPSNSS